MATSPSKRAGAGLSLVAATTLSALVGLVHAAAVTVPPPKDIRSGPIQLDAASTEVDYKNNNIVFRDVIISQGDMKIEAERAEANSLDFENGRWTFTGNVRLNMEERGNLQSDRAVVEFRNNLISRAIITGTPAVFQQKSSVSGQLARGRASAISYEVDAGTVRLSDNAWLTQAGSEISGPVIIYNIREKKVHAASEAGASDRVRITILPKQQGEKRDSPATSPK